MQEPVRPKPAWLDKLEHRVLLTAPPDKNVFLHDPRLRIDAIPELGGRVETTMLETSVSVRYPNTPYEAIVSATRAWSGTETGGKSDSVCTVSMRGISWDERMTSVGSWKQGNWEPELGAIFSDGELSFREGFVNFIRFVKRLQTMLGELETELPSGGY